VRRPKLLWQLYPSYLVITLLSLLAIAWISAGFLKEFYFSETTADLKTKAQLIERQIRNLDFLQDSRKLNQICRELAELAEIRVTIILPQGQVVADSEQLYTEMDNHAGRPEVVKALARQVGIARRYSNTLHENMIYLAIPHYREEKVAAVWSAWRFL